MLGLSPELSALLITTLGGVVIAVVNVLPKLLEVRGSQDDRDHDLEMKRLELELERVRKDGA